MGGQGSDQTSRGDSIFRVHERPGAFGEQIPDWLRMLYGFKSSTPSEAFGYGAYDTLNENMMGTDIGQAYQSELLAPQYGGQTDSEKAYLNQIMDVTANRSALRGIGAPTQSALSYDIAPHMLTMRQNRLNDLMGGVGMEQQNRQMRSGGMLQLMEDAMTQYIGGSDSTERSKGKSAGTGCCFIFLAAYDDVLDDVVRRYRDEHMNERNRRGYYRLADILVPLMKKYRYVKRAVKFIMTDPMVCYGGYFYGLNKHGVLCKPVAKLWLSVFNVLGFGKYVRSNGEVV